MIGLKTIIPSQVARYVTGCALRASAGASTGGLASPSAWPRTGQWSPCRRQIRGNARYLGIGNGQPFRGRGTNQSHCTLKSVDGRCPVTGKGTFGAALAAILELEGLLRKALSANVRRSGKGAMASITFMKKPIDEIKFPTEFERDAEHCKFGLSAEDFYLKEFGHLTIEANINLWGSLRRLDLGHSKCEATSPGAASHLGGSSSTPSQMPSPANAGSGM